MNHKHVIIALLAGVAVGYVFYNRLSTLPIYSIAANIGAGNSANS